MRLGGRSDARRFDHACGMDIRRLRNPRRRKAFEALRGGQRWRQGCSSKAAERAILAEDAAILARHRAGIRFAALRCPAFRCLAWNCRAMPVRCMIVIPGLRVVRLHRRQTLRRHGHGMRQRDCEAGEEQREQGHGRAGTAPERQWSENASTAHGTKLKTFRYGKVKADDCGSCGHVPGKSAARRRKRRRSPPDAASGIARRAAGRTGSAPRPASRP